jgi:hypothetical protein
MKKFVLASNLVLLVCALQISQLSAAVDMRMRFVSNTPNTPVLGQQTMIFYIQAKSVKTDVPHVIGSFQFVMQFGAQLWNQIPGATDEEKQAQIKIVNGYLRSSSFYARNVTFLSGRRIKILFELEPGQAPQTVPTDRWIRVARMVIVFNISDNASSQIVWADAPPFEVTDISEPPTNITGNTVGELDDISLPVEMSSLTALYMERESNEPVTHVKWETMSEMNCAGFYLERSDDGEFGSFQKTSPFITGNGTTTEKHQYEFWDDRNITYDPDPDTTTGTWYQIVQVDYDGTEETYGPVPIVKQAPLPNSFVLDQNYPNPFNPTTYIQYSLPEKIKVEVHVFNLLGANLRTLVNTEQPAGTYLLMWDGMDELGHRVGSGLYFYKLKAGNQILVRKMTLIR